MDLRSKLEQLERHLVWTIRDNATFEEVLQHCGMKADRHLFHEIDRETACRYLTRILYADLAYDCPEMSIEEASQLANGFLAEFPRAGSRYYSNGTASGPSTEGLPGVVRLQSWNQVGNATFDWGVLVVSPMRSGCVWAMDED